MQLHKQSCCFKVPHSHISSYQIIKPSHIVLHASRHNNFIMLLLENKTLVLSGHFSSVIKLRQIRHYNNFTLCCRKSPLVKPVQQTSVLFRIGSSSLMSSYFPEISLFLQIFTSSMCDEHRALIASLFFTFTPDCPPLTESSLFKLSANSRY